jgi:hypothetical protein
VQAAQSSQQSEQLTRKALATQPLPDQNNQNTLQTTTEQECYSLSGQCAVQVVWQVVAVQQTTRQEQGTVRTCRELQQTKRVHITAEATAHTSLYSSAEVGEDG